MYHSCIIGMNEAEKEAWKIYNNTENDPSINNWHKISALCVLIDINKSKFRMFQDEPAFRDLINLEDRLEKIKKETIENRDNSFKPFIKPASYEESKRLMELHKLGCNLPHLDESQISKQELERKEYQCR